MKKKRRRKRRKKKRKTTPEAIHDFRWLLFQTQV
jgi:hypothetical protein